MKIFHQYIRRLTRAALWVITTTFASAAPETTYTFSVLAGSPGVRGFVDGNGTDARLSYGKGIAVDAAGNIYVADNGNRAVRKITPSGTVTTVANSRTGVPFEYLTGIAVDRGENLYVGDASSGSILRVSPDSTVTILAGGRIGFADGILNVAEFDVPSGLATDLAGNIYATDGGVDFYGNYSNNLVRKITPAGLVSTLAGRPREVGSADGAGSAARFSFDTYGGFAGIAIDRLGFIYVADIGNYTIRKISPEGVVSTLAGQAGIFGLADGVGTAAQFSAPFGLAVDVDRNVFVADGRAVSYVIRKITPEGKVTTVTDRTSNLQYPQGIAVDGAGNLYVFDNATVRKGIPSAAPFITAQSSSQTLTLGSTAVLSVTATGLPTPTLQWSKNGNVVAGAINSTLVLNNVNATDAGQYTCTVTNTSGTSTSEPVTLSLAAAANVGRIINFSVRSLAGSGSQTLYVGLSIGGGAATSTLPVLLRAVGPSLAAFGVPTFLTDPKLELHNSAGKLGENDNWNSEVSTAGIIAQVGAFPFANAASKDAAWFAPALSPGGYHLVVTGAVGTSGTVLAEVYDAAPDRTLRPSPTHLTNVSARSQVGTGEVELIAGFVIAGETSKTLYIRAIGPSLATFGVDGPLADPVLRVYSGNTLLQENNDWTASNSPEAALIARTGAFALPPGSKDAALFITLPPGAYTAHASSADDLAGIALMEIFEVP